MSIFPYKWVLTVLVIITFFLVVLSHFPKSKFFRIYLFFTIIIGVLVITYSSLNWNTSFSELREIFIPFVVFVIGCSYYYDELDNRMIHFIVFTSIVSIIFVALQQILSNIGGFIIADLYLVVLKNSLGGLLAINTVLATLELFNQRKKPTLYILFLQISIIIMIIEMLTIRSRLAVTSAVLVMVYVFILYLKYNKSRNAVITGFVFVAIFLIIIALKPVQEFVLSSFLQNKEDDLLSGRSAGLSQAISILLSNPYTGNLIHSEEIPWVHNYLLLKSSNYGLLLGLPWILLYCYIFFYVIKHSLSSRIEVLNYGFFLALVPFIISIGEPTFPYGPGTVNFIPFFLLGLSVESMTNKVNFVVKKST